MTVTISAGKRSKLEADAGKPLGLFGLNELLQESQKHGAKGNLVLAVQRMRQAHAFCQALVDKNHSLLGSIKAQLATLLEKQQVYTNKQFGENPERASALKKETAELWKHALASLEHNTNSLRLGDAQTSSAGSRAKRQAKGTGDTVKRRFKQRSSDATQRFNIEQVFKIPIGSEPGATTGLVRRAINLNELTPRSHAVCTKAKARPRWLQLRTFHQFYDPSKRVVDQQRQFDNYCKRRTHLWEDLRVDRQLNTLEHQTEICNVKAANKKEKQTQSAYRKKFRIDEMKQPDNARGPVVLPHVQQPKVNSRLKLRLIKDDDGTGGNIDEKEGGIESNRVVKREQFLGASHETFEVARKYELCCPSCCTLYDFKTYRCRKCQAPVDWRAVIETAAEHTDKPFDPAKAIDPEPSHNAFPLAELAAHQSLTKVRNTITEQLKINSLYKFARRIVPGLKHSTETAAAQKRHYAKLERVLQHIQSEQRSEVKRETYLCGILDAKERAKRARVLRLYRGAAMDTLYQTMDEAKLLRSDDKSKLARAIDREFSLA